jgi:hypothetical protein
VLGVRVVRWRARKQLLRAQLVLAILAEVALSTRCARLDSDAVARLQGALLASLDDDPGKFVAEDELPSDISAQYGRRKSVRDL